MTDRFGAAYGAVVLALALLLIPTWSGHVDAIAQDRTRDAFQSALVTFAVARTLNGVISVAQGTELAFQPAGVGIVVTAGEILDPLNDLVEQFSWLTLLAASSLGAQILLSEMFATPFANAALTLAVLAAALAWLFAPRTGRLRSTTLKLAVALTIVRFAIAFATLTTSWITTSFLTEREQESVAYLTDTSAAIEEKVDAQSATTAPLSTLGAISELLDDAREAANLKARIDALKTRAEAAIGHIVNLIVVYTVETLLLPIALLAVAWAALKWSISRITPERR